MRQRRTCDSGDEGSIGALGKIPTGLWDPNAAYFQIVVFAHNLVNWFKRFCVPPEAQRLSLQTLRQRLLVILAELVRPQGRAVLKIPCSYPHKEVFVKTLDGIDEFDLP